MTKIICFEGVHGSGKSTLIDFFLKELESKYTGKYAVIRDSEYPEFERVKKDIRSGIFTDRGEIVTTVANTRAQIYSRHINPLLNSLDLAILDRSYYTSAVWQSESLDEMYNIIVANSRNVPCTDMTFILFAPLEVLMNRLTSRKRDDLQEHDSTRISNNQAKYLHLAQKYDECIAFDTNREPTILAREVYNLMLANNAL